MTTTLTVERLARELGEGAESWTGRKKRNYNSQNPPLNSRRRRGTPIPFASWACPSNDVTEVTSRRPERGCRGRLSRSRPLVGRQLGAGERVSGRAGERARAGRREATRGAEERQVRAAAEPTAGEGRSPSRAPRGPHPHSAGQCPVFLRAGGGGGGGG